MLAECPHCHKHTISRWRDFWRWNGYAPLICPNCHTPVRANLLLRYVLTVGPMLITSLPFGHVVAHWEPVPPLWVVLGGFVACYLFGWWVGAWFSRYKEFKVKTPPLQTHR